MAGNDRVEIGEVVAPHMEDQSSLHKWKAIRRCAVVGMILIATAAAWFYHVSTAERRNADRIIEAIEQYRKVHGRLPHPDDHALMARLGFELRVGWHPDYEVGEKGFYRITILEGFDGPYWTYDSYSRMWRKDFVNGGGLGDRSAAGDRQ